MTEKPSVKARLSTITASELLVTGDAELQGVKDRRLDEVIRSYTRREIEFLCLSAASGKIRDLAHRIVGRDLNMRARKYVQTHIADARERYKSSSALRIRAIIEETVNPDEADMLRILQREKAWKEVAEMTTERVRALLAEPDGSWPTDILETVMRGRTSFPGAVEPDWWREQS